MLTNRELIDILLGCAVRVEPGVYYVRRSDGAVDWYIVYGVPVPNYVQKRTVLSDPRTAQTVWKREQ